MEVVAMSQNDRQWRAEKLLGSSLTIGNYGCLQTCNAIILKFFGWNTDPSKLNQLLINNGGKNSQGFYSWGLIAKIYGGTEDVTDSRGRRLKAGELQVLKDAIKKAPVAIQVDMKPSTEASDMHFVLGYEVTGNDIKIVDPWNGEKTTILTKYAKAGWDLNRAIERFSVLRVPFKDGLKPQEPVESNDVKELKKELQETKKALGKKTLEAHDAAEKLKAIAKIAK